MSRRVEESVVVRNLQITPVEVPNSGGWGVRVLREERAMYSSGREHALPALTQISLGPPLCRTRGTSSSNLSLSWERIVLKPS